MYNEILRLKNMLELAKIPFKFRVMRDGYQLKLNSDIDAIEHCNSRGSHRDLLEIKGGLTREELELDDVKGYMTANEVFMRFKYCYENSTSLYKG